MQRGQAVLMDIEAPLFMRQDVARLGLAPLTSMFWYSETVEADGDRLAARDPRLRRPGDVDRQGRAHLAAAQQSAAARVVSAFSDTARAASACCSATATSTTIWTA